MEGTNDETGQTPVSLPPSEEKTRRKRRKKQNIPDTAESPSHTAHSDRSETVTGDYSSQFLRFPSDILAPEDEDKEHVQLPSEGSADLVASQPTPTVFVQQTAGFKKTQREQMQEILAARQQKQIEDTGGWDQPMTNTMQAGVISQKLFHSFGVILQGFLAGFSVCHCILVFFFTPPFAGYKEFLDIYARLALPTHSLYYVGFLLCTVAALDRYDIGQSFLRVVIRAVTFQSGGLAVVAYVVAVIMSLVSRPVEERMALYFHHNRTHLILSEKDATVIVEQPWLFSDMTLWKATLIARAVASVLAWCLVAARPGTDLLQKHMLQAEQHFSTLSKTRREDLKQ